VARVDDEHVGAHVLGRPPAERDGGPDADPVTQLEVLRAAVVPDGGAGVRPTVSLCWRTTENVSAYVLVIDPRHDLRLDAAAGALDQAWKQSVA
jgi:hypothetical protein